MNRATCEMCRRVEEGETLTPEAIRTYRMAKADKQDVTYFELPSDPVPKEDHRISSMFGSAIRAIGFKKKDPAPVAPSQVLSKEKRRTRLFADTKLGNIDKDKKKK